MEYDFDKALHRKIRSGSEFDKLIPKSQNTNINFETSSKQILESDTFDTLIYINQWVDKYHGQLSKIAPLLKGKNTAQTAANIYQWLYNHFQYQLDKSPLKQRLFSPAAAWKHRASGIDCKSFSLLASCLLTEMKVPHSLRMVKQKGVKSFTNPNEWILNPNYWSHVYVVVPEGTKFHIIDATTHNNKEVEIVTKYDHNIMIHQGLNGAIQKNSLGCSCQGVSTQKHGLGNPNTLGIAIDNFHTYLNELERRGISREVTNSMLGMVRYNVERGIDPNINEIISKASMQHGQLGSVVGEFINSSASSAVSQIYSTSVGGVQVGDVAALALGDPTAVLGIAKGLLNNILPAQFLSSTFGAVFANGFDLSCWRATYPGNFCQERLKIDAEPHFNKLIEAIKASRTVDEMEITVNAFIKDSYQFRATAQGLYEATDWSTCSRKGIDFYRQYGDKMIEAANKICQDLAQKGWTVEEYTSTVQGLQLALDFFHDPHTKGYKSKMVKKPIFKTNATPNGNGTPNTGTPKADTPNAGTPNTGTPKADTPNAGTPKAGTPKDTTSNKGVNPLLIVSGIGIALKLIL